MRAITAGRLLVAGLLVGGLAMPAGAQTKVLGMNVEGEIEAGFRLFLDEPSERRSAKFEEYRDLPGERPFLEKLKLRFFRPDESYSAEFEGSKWGQEDQEFSLRAERLGRWQFGFEWDQIPHIFSTTGRSLATEERRGFFTLPTPRPGLPTHNEAPRIDEISTRWDTARMFLTLTPTPDLELKAEYMRINKDGDRPMGMPFGSPGGQFYEILEPIEQTIHDFRLRGTIAREQWQLQFGYVLSIFQNDLDRVIADNPSFAGASSARGQSALPPDNMAHTFTLGGGVNVPWWRTRVNSNLSYSLRLQNEDFLPHSLNPPAAVATNALALPQKSLNGNVQVFLFNLDVTSRPLRPLTLRAKYRLYNFTDWSDEITFPAHVVNDQRTVVVENRRAGRWDYTTHNAELDARWRIVQPVALTLGAGWERWNRNVHREASETDELSGKAALDVTPFDWLLARVTYKPSFRRLDFYKTTAHAEHTVVDDPAAIVQGQFPFLRKFDEADRDRQRVDLTIQLTPTETFSITPVVGYRTDDYINSAYGLLDEVAWSAGMDIGWTPSERIAFTAGYMRELINRRQRSTDRNPQDFTDYVWVSDNIDTVDTVHASLEAALIPRVLDLVIGGSFSNAIGKVKTFNPIQPTSGTAANDLVAQAKDWPAFQDRLLRLEGALKYHFWKNWTASLKYIFESFDKDDWRTDLLNPFIPGATSIWMGNDIENYTAHIATFTVGYRF